MKNDAILKHARERIDRAIRADLDNREAALDDVRFLTGDQWEPEDRRAREADGKPVLTINLMPQSVRQVTGDLRRLNPAVRVIPADEAAQPETAEILQGMIRGIEYRSDASSVYERAAEDAARCGMGAFRIVTEYEADDSFNQEIWVKSVHNPFSLYIDPDAVEPMRQDAMYMFITDTMSEERFKEEYPDKAAVDAERDGLTEGQEHWRDGDDVVVAEYYWKEPEEVEIGMLRSGQVVEKPVAPMDIIQKRTVRRHKVKWAKISGKDVLEGPQDIPSRHIPIITVVGEEINVGGDIVRSSVIRYAKDSQRLYNFWSSVDAEVTAQQPKAPYMVTPKQIAGLENIWNAAHTKTHPYLVYNPDALAPPPQRIPPPIPSSALAQGAIKAREDMKGTTGIHEAGLGMMSNETSGVAIRQRQIEGDIANSIYSDNLAKSIEHCGRILVDMIPRVYDTNRTVRVMGEDDQEKLEQVNGLVMTMDGPQEINPLGNGRFDVRVSVGPNYTTRRQETAESMMQFIQAFPAAGQIAGDLIAKSMDWPDADKLAERLRKILPPGMIDPEDMTPEEQQAMQAQAQQAQMSEQMQAQMAQMAMQARQIEMQKNAAEAEEAGHDARKAEFEVLNEQLNLAAQNGELQAIIQQEVLRALQMMAQPAPMGR